VKVNGQYLVKEKIGQGSFGQVYKGNTKVVLKFF